jgi:hypothetical protein
VVDALGGADGPQLVAADAFGAPALAWADGFALLAYVGFRGDDREVVLAALDGTGDVVVAPMNQTDEDGFAGFPAVAADGARIAVAWEDGRVEGPRTTYARLGSLACTP